jgi:hypothetical protein
MSLKTYLPDLQYTAQSGDLLLSDEFIHFPSLLNGKIIFAFILIWFWWSGDRLLARPEYSPLTQNGFKYLATSEPSQNSCWIQKNIVFLPFLEQHPDRNSLFYISHLSSLDSKNWYSEENIAWYSRNWGNVASRKFQKSWTIADRTRRPASHCTDSIHCFCMRKIHTLRSLDARSL